MIQCRGTFDHETGQTPGELAFSNKQDKPSIYSCKISLSLQIVKKCLLDEKM